MKILSKIALIFTILAVILTAIPSCVPNESDPGGLPPIVNPPSTDNPDPNYKPPGTDTGNNDDENEGDEGDEGKDIPSLPSVPTNPNE